MTPKGVIDQVIKDRDGTDPADTTNTNRINQLLSFLQSMQDYIEGFREWEWLWDEATVTILSGSRKIAVPADFRRFGRHGGCWDAAIKRRYKEVSRHLMSRIRLEQTATNLYVFCIRNGQIEIPFDVSSNLTLTLIFLNKSATLAYNTAAMAIPDQYQYTVIIPALTAKAQESKDDANPNWFAYLRDGLSQMCTEENPQQTTVQRMPLAARGAW